MQDGSIGFIGLGVMGAPMCRHLRDRSGRAVVGLDERADRRVEGVAQAADAASLAAGSAVVFLSLPAGPQVQAVCEGALFDAVRPGTVVVDLGTSPVDLTRALAAEFGRRGAAYADAPVARTRAAAEAATLSVTVGADPATFAALQPLLATFATDVTHCGPVGTGQVVKLMNNMVLAQTVVALSEALAAGRRAGVERDVLFEALGRGSADSFALRNHGMKAILPEDFPEQAFSTDAMRKDLSYALALAESLDLDLRGAENAAAMLLQASMRGDGARYWPVVSQVIDETRSRENGA